MYVRYSIFTRHILHLLTMNNINIVTFNIVVFLFKLSIAAKGTSSQQVLSDKQVHYLSDLTDSKYTKEVFKHLLVPRVVGTEGHKNVANYITNELDKLGYEIEMDEFQERTPNFGVLTFKNIIARLNPKATKFLVLACHYDSKFFSEFNFIGATDSAVPCAMILNLAKVLQKELNNAKNQTSISLKLVFFDGEEAFQQWGPNDSIYGAKHLAQTWGENLRVAADGNTMSHIESIDVLVLLDLIGAKNPKFYSFFENTRPWYNILSNAEKQLSSLGLLTGYSNRYFVDRSQYSFIEDDHIPFYHRGVKVVHVIPTPFPFVWHREEDNANAIDLDVVENLNKIFRVFVAKSLHLSVTQI